MSKNDEIIYNLFALLKENNFNYIVFCSSLKDTSLEGMAKKLEFECLYVEDARSVGYFGTGLCAETSEKVIVCLEGNNEARNIMPALTEAYYRELPVMLVTISERSNQLKWKQEFNDTVVKYFHLCESSSENALYKMADSFAWFTRPYHIDVSVDKSPEEKNLSIDIPENQKSSLLSLIASFPKEEIRLFVSNDIGISIDDGFSVIRNSGAYSDYGTISCMVGASFARSDKTYITIVTEKEFIHDMNVLGNRCIGNNIVVIVIADEMKDMISHYAHNLGFSILGLSELKDNITRHEGPIITII